ncbi:ChuX/HutX family heme-like substrate-binding protein [Pseudomonas auratipiscis]|uniref:ChuX/HutX family heme-like substrate-binding protein n=1 Tax=Pseudomonas auratipiscis TaxID=3115853 RepID=A0AB35WTQ3_9PSED|nr:MULTISPECIES: ChuX/HutX family heme-like substrate-binding protein [unclassified Pseudomonas]MEE1866619.1 ChuX/HutX family heme-like substrate-binding protein [Pseudomonas sp. 120P]MEE1957394.1 ChuX/HutX family heme-like substrate-binding protein [Pseudomonas sp. 119P]
MIDMTGAELAACIGIDFRALQLSSTALAEQLHTLGEVRTRTTAGAAFIEQLGSFPCSEDVSEAGLVIGEDGLDLRLNLRAWFWIGMRHDPRHEQFSLTVFDRQCRCLLTLTSTSGSQLSAWVALYAQSKVALPQFDDRNTFAPREMQAPGLLQDWAAMANVHDHFALLKRHGLSRYEANQLVAAQFSRQLELRSCTALFELLAASGLELMLFIYSAGSVQIFTGVLVDMQRIEGALVFNMPATELAAPTLFSITDASATEVWQVRKPNEQGGVTSLELFDDEQRLIVQVFARRPAGQPEQSAWREWLEALESH